jgi:hypothetical protein
LSLHLAARGESTQLYGNNPPILVPKHVFDRSRFHAGKSYRWTSRAAKTGSPFTGVVPIQGTHQYVAHVPGIKVGSSKFRFRSYAVGV